MFELIGLEPTGLRFQVTECVKVILSVTNYPAQKGNGFRATVGPVYGHVDVLHRNIVYLFEWFVLQLPDDTGEVTIEFLVIIYFAVSVQVDR